MGIPKAADVDVVEPRRLGVDLCATKLLVKHKASTADDREACPPQVEAHSAGSDATEHDSICDELGGVTGVVLFGDPGIGQWLLVERTRPVREAESANRMHGTMATYCT